MPTVDLNRLYKVRSRERRPVLNPTSVPDAAGAYLRSVRPAQEAQLGISRANAELDADKWRHRAQGIQTGIRAFEDTYDAYSRARERQKAVDLKKAQNDFQIAWLGARQGILDTPYDRTKTDKDGNVRPTGPGTASKEWLAAYDKSKIPASVREEFDEWFAFRSAEINAEADAAHEKLRQADVAQTFKNAFVAADAAVAEYEDPNLTGNGYQEWVKAVKDAQTALVDQSEYLLGIRDAAGNKLRNATPEETTQISKSLRELGDKYNINRLKQVQALYIETGDQRYLDELRSWGMGADEYKAQLESKNSVLAILPPTDDKELRDDADRASVRQLAKEAVIKRHQHLKALDDMAISEQTENLAALGTELDPEKHAEHLNALKAVADSLTLPESRRRFREDIDEALFNANTNLSAETLGNIDNPESRDRLLDALEARADELSTPAQKELHKKKVMDLKAGFEIFDFNKTWEAEMALVRSAEDATKAWVDASKRLADAANGLKTEKGREHAQNLILTGGEAIGAQNKALAMQKKQEIEWLDTYVQHGGRGGKFHAKDVVDIMRRFHAISEYMEPEQAVKIGKHLHERIHGGGLDVPTGEEVRQVFDWMGWKTSELDTLIGTLRDGQFTESGTAIILQGGDGWEVSQQRFTGKADKGFIDIDVRGTGNSLPLGVEDIKYILDTIHQCKEAALLRNDPGGAFAEIQKQLEGVKEKHRRDRIVRAARLAAQEAQDSWWMFSSPQEYSTWRPRRGGTLPEEPRAQAKEEE